MEIKQPQTEKDDKIYELRNTHCKQVTAGHVSKDKVPNSHL